MAQHFSRRRLLTLASLALGGTLTGLFRSAARETLLGPRARPPSAWEYEATARALGLRDPMDLIAVVRTPAGYVSKRYDQLQAGDIFRDFWRNGYLDNKIWRAREVLGIKAGERYCTVVVEDDELSFSAWA